VRCQSEAGIRAGQKIRIGFDPARASIFDPRTADASGDLYGMAGA